MIEYEIHMRAVCDGCGEVLCVANLKRPSDIDPQRWKWQREWKERRVMTRERKYQQPTIYCERCADGNPTPHNNKLSGGAKATDPKS